MSQNIEDLREQNRNRLIALALAHLQFEGIASAMIPIPGSDRVIAIGTPAQVRGLLGTAAKTSDLMTVDCPACDGSAGCDECSGQGQIIVSRADMAAAHADHADSEGGHHD
jgi:hypothetical protein